MKIGREALGRLWRLVLFAAVAVGAVAFVAGTRGRELRPVPQAVARNTRNGTAASGGYYILFRLARARAEAQEESVLRTVAAAAGASAADRARAGADLEAVARAAREESEIESVLRGQGFAQSAVVISNGGAVVVVPAKGMTVGAARRIGIDLWNLAGIAPERVLIRPRA